MVNRGQKVYVVFGPSGCGKTTMIRKIIEECPDKYCFTISHTTRQPRSKETQGVEYHFTTRERFKEMIEEGDFIETTKFSGNLYGTSYRAFKDGLNSGKSPILDIDVEGVKSFRRIQAQKAAFSDHAICYVYIKTPTIEILEQRLRSRGTNSEEDIERRIQTGRCEVKWADSQTNFDCVIVNDDFESSYNIFKKALDC